MSGRNMSDYRGDWKSDQNKKLSLYSSSLLRSTMWSGSALSSLFVVLLSSWPSPSSYLSPPSYSSPPFFSPPPPSPPIHILHCHYHRRWRQKCSRCVHRHPPPGGGGVDEHMMSMNLGTDSIRCLSFKFIFTFRSYV